MTVDELIEAFASEPTETGRRARSGFSDLDHATGGLSAGQVWIVTGAPGQGKSTLLTQWAAQLALDEWQTLLVCPREPRDFTAARLLASTRRIPLLHLHRGHAPVPDTTDRPDRLLGKPLHIATQGQLTFLDGGDPADKPSLDAIVIDDADAAAGVWPKRVASLARRGALVVLSMSRHTLLGDEDDQFLDEEWAHVADVVIDVRQADGPITRPTIRPGEADLFLLKNRWGPTQSIAVGFQGHYARFVDFKR